MRTLYVVVVALVASLLVALGSVGAVSAGFRPDGLPFFLIAVALILLALPPIALSAFLQWWPTDPSRGTGRRNLVRLTAAGAVVQLAGGGVVLALVAGTSVAPWQPITFLGAVAVVSALNLLGAVAVRRRGGSPGGPHGEWSFSVTRAKFRTVGLWVSSTLLLSAVSITALAVQGAVDSPRELWLSALLALALACTVGSVTCLAVARPLARRLRELRSETREADLEPGRPAHRAPDGPHETGPAVRYARILMSYLPFRLAQVTLLHAGLVLSQLPRTLIDGRPDLPSVAVVAVLLVTYAVFVPPMLLRWARARRFTAEHALAAS